jgi:hypothetical protein
MAGGTAYNNFKLAYVYALNNPRLGLNGEAVNAQPLYITNVTTSLNTSPNCNTTPCNILIVASLSGTVYAFNTGLSPGTSGTGTNNLLWHYNMLANCGANGEVYDNSNNGFPGVRSLRYYGAVTTPAIDIVSGQDPTVFFVSACVDKTNSPKKPQWFINAIDIVTSKTAATQLELKDSTNGFRPENQVARAALLVTHPDSSSTFVNVTFGDGVAEIGAEDGSGGPTYRYTGAVFPVKYSYSTSLFSVGTPPAFYTTCTGATSGCASGTFPNVFTGTDGNHYPTGPAGGNTTICNLPTPTGGPPTSNPCSPGGNWAVNGGGCWMSSRGPASSGSADVLLACSNGAFACSTTQNQTGCLSASGVKYWGQSAIELPEGNDASPTVPQDFYAPYQQLYTCTTSGCTPSWDTGTPSTYQTQELSRLDQDFGTSGMTVLAQSNGVNFLVTADKAGFVYLMPPPFIETSGSSLGLFQRGDAGLMGTSYQTEAPFRASRLPDSTNPPVVCPVVNVNGLLTSTNGCDEIHEIAYDAHDNLIFIWPSNETVMAYKGTFTVGTPTTYNFYQQGTTNPLRIDPCSGATHCTNFPAADINSAGGAMSLATDGATTTSTCTTLPCIELFSIVPKANSQSALVGRLYAYNVASSGTLTYLYSNPATVSACTGGPTVKSWLTTSFTQPTLADNSTQTTTYGAVYVPTVCSITNTTDYSGCQAAPSSAVQNGILVFTNCPSSY